MNSLTKRVLCKKDYVRIEAIYNKLDIANESLEHLIANAEICENEEISITRVGIDSHVDFLDLDSKKSRSIYLTLPSKKLETQNAISILSPVGLALIGACVNDFVSFMLPNSKLRKLHILNVSR